MVRPLAVALLAAGALASCAKLATKPAEAEKAPNPIGITRKPLVRSSAADQGAGASVPQPDAASLQSLFTDDPNIVHTDPDNPDAEIPELDSVLAAPKRGPWEASETIAKQRSVREGKPMLIWFTDSRSSPMCLALSQELFSTNEFGAWATDNLVRLKIDAMPDKELLAKTETMGDSEDLRTRMRTYSAELRKRYKVMGYPSLVMVSPSGEVTGRERGYKRGEAELIWGKLKHATAVSQESYKGWRAGMEKKGYREWHGRRDQTVFAKLVSYSKGSLILIEPDGTRMRTTESNLSSGDRAWIAEQKQQRGL